MQRNFVRWEGFIKLEGKWALLRPAVPLLGTLLSDSVIAGLPP